MIGALAPAASAEATSGCSRGCVKSLRVGGSAVRWISPQTFGADAAVEVKLFAARRELDAEPVTSCSARFYGAGVLARVDICAKPRGPITVRTVSVEAKPARIRIRYRVR